MLESAYFQADLMEDQVFNYLYIEQSYTKAIANVLLISLLVALDLY